MPHTPSTRRRTRIALVVAVASLTTSQENQASQHLRADVEEAEKVVFLSHLRVGRFRMNNPVARLRADVYLALRDGRFRDAVQVLLESGRGGNLDAYEALPVLLIPCIRSPESEQYRSARRSRERTAALERAATLQLPPDVLERLEWAFEADATDSAQVRAALCPDDDQSEVSAWRQESKRAMSKFRPETPPDDQQRLRAATPQEHRELMSADAEESNRWLSEAGLTMARHGKAQGMLQSKDPEVRSRGLQLLRDLAESSPSAKVDLASCIRRRCAPNAGDDAQALELLIAAARAGNDSALMRLSNTRVDPSAPPPTPLGLPPSEHYAWAKVTDRLMTDGCFGTNYFIAWTTTTPTRLGLNLMEMSPAEAERARARAQEMLASELPQIRAAIGCE